MNEYQFAYFPIQEQIHCERYQRKVGPNTNKMHMHNAQELVLITSPGRVRIVSNGVDFMVDTPAVILNRQGAFHAVVEVYEQLLDGFVCFFHTGLFTLMPQENYEKTLCRGNDLMILSISKAQCDALASLFDWMTQKSAGQKRYLLLCVFQQLKEWLEDGAAPLRTSSNLTYIFEVARLLQDLQSKEDLTLAGLAERFHVSQTKLKSDFKKVAGVPLHMFRRHAQLQEARMLLENTDTAVGRIAASCGFSDEGYFIRAFRQKYGVTPGGYRKQVK